MHLLLNIYRFEVNVLDINSNLPTFQSPEIDSNIVQSAFPGERFPLPNAFDADIGSNLVKSYTQLIWTRVSMVRSFMSFINRATTKMSVYFL